MPLLGAIELWRSGEHCRGAAFVLRNPPAWGATVRLHDDSEVCVARGAPYVVARLAPTATGDLYEQALRASQVGLDWLSVRAGLDLEIVDPHSEHLTWWEGVGGCILEIFSEVPLNFTVSPIKLIVGDKTEPDERKDVAGDHSGFRYFRLAQLSGDLHAAYRNMWLAFELTLSRKHPPRQGEREGDWIKRTLAASETDLGLASLLGVAPDQAPEDAYQRLYLDARLPLFHAKFARTVYPPADPGPEREVVREALVLLTRIVLAMFRSWFGADRKGGFVYTSWVYKELLTQWSGARVLVSAQKEADCSHSLEAVVGKAGVPMDSPTVGTLPDGRPELQTQLSISSSEAAPTLRCFDLVNDEAPLIAHLLEADLKPEGLTQIRLRIRPRVRTSNQPMTLSPRVLPR